MVQNTIAGYGIVKPDFFGHCFIEMVYLAENWRGHGYGPEMLAYMPQKAATDRIFTSCNQFNTRMQHLLNGIAGVIRVLSIISIPTIRRLSIAGLYVMSERNIYENHWQITAHDGKTIYGVTNRAAIESLNDLIIIVHGLTDHKDAHPLITTTPDFLAAGYDVVRFDLYNEAGDACKLYNCTIDSHARDISRVINVFRPSYHHIFLIGHSYGGAAVMIANPPDITGAVLWEPTYPVDIVWHGDNLNAFGGNYLLRSRVDFLINKTMVETDSRYDRTVCRELSRQAAFPLKVIHGDKGILFKDDESYHTYAAYECDYALIENAGHIFAEFETKQELINQTIS